MCTSRLINTDYCRFQKASRRRGDDAGARHGGRRAGDWLQRQPVLRGTAHCADVHTRGHDVRTSGGLQEAGGGTPQKRWHLVCRRPHHPQDQSPAGKASDVRADRPVGRSRLAAQEVHERRAGVPAHGTVPNGDGGEGLEWEPLEGKKALHRQVRRLPLRPATLLFGSRAPSSQHWPRFPSLQQWLAPMPCAQAHARRAPSNHVG